MTRRQELIWAHGLPRASMEVARMMIVEGQGAVKGTTGGGTAETTTAEMTDTMTAEDADTRADTTTAAVHATIEVIRIPEIATTIEGEEAGAARDTRIVGAMVVRPADMMTLHEATTIAALVVVTIVTIATMDVVVMLMNGLLLRTTEDATRSVRMSARIDVGKIPTQDPQVVPREPMFRRSQRPGCSVESIFRDHTMLLRRLLAGASVLID
mmetsp:Transcript_6102/g.14092  ORF Transcript_6102/g.14092 Transcript_6102/m.14092 type:complete len:212 (+) Transcript_6102:482-1117(+)